MSSTSIGTGTAQDANENLPRPADPWPSRTLGADSPAGDAGRNAAPLPAQGEGNPAEVVDESSSLPQVDLSPEQVDQAFPEGPNVAPSPFEEEAARGRS
jgi:hypothetical protein